MPNMAATLAFGASLLAVAAAQTTIQLSFNGSLPLDRSDYVDPSFAGLGIEPSNLFSFTGYDQPNKLTFNLIDNLANYTGKPPHMRIGGNTQDYMVFDPNMMQWTWINNPNVSSQEVGSYWAPNHMLIGPRFFQAANRFPQGTPVTWGLNLGYVAPDYIQQIVTMANQVIENTGNLHLVSFEIGNEPDLYIGNGFRTGVWDGQTYVQQWLNRASALWEQVLKPNGIPSNFFEPGATASTIGTTFQISDLQSYGIGVQANGSQKSYVASWNQHDYYYYIGVSGYPLDLDTFLTLSTTDDQFAAWVTQIKFASTTPYPYALREMGVVGPIGMEGITNTFGAALWQLNFLLYTASLNITTVQMHQTDNSNASILQPIEMYNRQPFVRPIYYGFAAFDQIIGPTCQAQVAPYPITAYPQNYAGRIKVYSVFQAGQLATIVVINSRMANVTSTKSSLSVSLSLPTSLAGQVLHLSLLTNTGADATANTTWNGMSYERNGDGTSTVVDNSDSTITIPSDGNVTLTVRDSQAMVANIGSRVGSGRSANSAACAAIAQRSPGIGSVSTTSTSRSSSSSSVASNTRGASTSSTSQSGVQRISALICSVMGAGLLAGALLLW